MPTIKAISIKEPWADKIAYGDKTIETRTWKTDYRGPILICSSKLPSTRNSGKALAIAQLVEIRHMQEGDEELSFCPVDPARYSWILEDIRPLKRQLDISGKQRLFEVSLTEREMEVVE